MKSCLVFLTLLTSQFLGADSKLYPFANMTFADMVNTYLPIFTQLNNKNLIKTITRHLNDISFFTLALVLGQNRSEN